MEMHIVSNLIKTKDEEQRKALNAWAQNSNFNGSLIAGTGFGKSRCGVLAVNKMLINSNADNKRGLILVPTQQLQTQFREEFIKWDCEDVLEYIDIICYQSAYKLQDQHYTIVVCDEIHLGLSPKYRKFFENNSWDKL